jgi:hypothetical protein
MIQTRTGEAEEERVEDVVSERALETHEERGEVFTWLAGMALAAGVAALVIPTRRAQLAAAAAASVAAVAVGGAAYWVGHSGGELVYKNGAAAAYFSGALGTAREQGREGEDD